MQIDVPLSTNLASTLRKRVQGEVRFPGSRPPIGVVIPRTIDDGIVTVEECRNHGVPILGRGCGTRLAGQTCNVAVVIDFSKYLNRLRAVDPGAKLARVEPGTAEKYHFTFAPAPPLISTAGSAA